ncbi:TPA: PTS sugar transporter subunit IIB [Staphylococcus aureus]
MKQVLVACGAGIATSTVVNNAIEEMAKEHNIKQIKITEVGPYEDTADLLVTTAMTKKEYKFPVINARNFLTGIGIEETKQQILTELQK